ncbi:heme-binding beta-barrel domain-containing protein [Pseudoduganella ginsengisoli]
MDILQLLVPRAMSEFSDDIYTEPSDVDVNTLANLGPLTAMAGVWQGERGLDIKPKKDGPRKQAYVERIELQPIDPVTNGPQLFYGLRYVIFITKPDQVKTYHEQVGYWLWEPATKTVIQTLAIPRGQIAMASGTAEPDAKTFELVAERASETYGIRSNPFLEYGFKTVEYRIKVTIHDDGTWGYEEDTVMLIRGKEDEPFHHIDRNLLQKVGEPTPNPLARR